MKFTTPLDLYALLAARLKKYNGQAPVRYVFTLTRK